MFGIEKEMLADEFEIVEFGLPRGTDFVVANIVKQLLAQAGIASQLLKEVVFEEEGLAVAVGKHLAQVFQLETRRHLDIAEVHLVLVANDLEGVLGATADADAGALEQAERGIEGYGLLGAQGGRRWHGEVVDAVVGVVEQGYDLEFVALGGWRHLAVDERGVLADGHAIDHGGASPDAHKRAIGALHDGTIDIVAVGVGAVEHHEGYAAQGAGLHDIVERGDIGVEAAADVLQVEKNDVDVGHLVGGGLLVAAVERHDGDFGLFVGAVAYALARGGGATEAVLGTEDFGGPVFERHEGVNEVAAFDQRGVVGDDGETLALDERQVFVHALGSDHDALGRERQGESKEEKDGY